MSTDSHRGYHVWVSQLSSNRSEVSLVHTIHPISLLYGLSSLHSARMLSKPSAGVACWYIHISMGVLT